MLTTNWALPFLRLLSPEPESSRAIKQVARPECKDFASSDEGLPNCGDDCGFSDRDGTAPRAYGPSSSFHEHSAAASSCLLQRDRTLQDWGCAFHHPQSASQTHDVKTSASQTHYVHVCIGGMWLATALSNVQTLHLKTLSSTPRTDELRSQNKSCSFSPPQHS